MQRFTLKSACSYLTYGKKLGANVLKNKIRQFATADEILFPKNSDFPGRHIGPRKTDVVAMLDTLGYKVGI